MAGADAAAATAAVVVVVVVDGVVVVVAAVVVVVGAELLAVLVDVIPPGAGLVLRQQDRGARAALSVARHLHTARPGLLGVLLLLLVSAEGVAQAQDVDDAEGGGLARRPLVDVRVPGAWCGESDGPGVQTPTGYHLEAAAAAVKVARDDQSHPHPRQHPQSRGGLGGRGAVHVEVQAGGHGFTHHHPARPSSRLVTLRHTSSHRHSGKHRTQVPPTPQSCVLLTVTRWSHPHHSP